MKTLLPSTIGESVRALQVALNARSRPRGLPLVTIDGVYGKETEIAVERVARALGAAESTIAKRGATVGEQHMIFHPGRRTPAQLARAASRAIAAQRAAAAAAAKRTGPELAIAEARRYIGKTEQPAGTNTAPWGLAAWIRHFLGLGYGVAWCGIFVGHCLEAAQVAVNGRVASVRFIYDDARAGRNGFAHLVGVQDGQPGDAAGLFGLSTHVEIIEKRVPGGYQTIGGNTSAGAAGSQANGGGVYRRVRPYSAVVYIARPAYQED